MVDKYRMRRSASPAKKEIKIKRKIATYIYVIGKK